MARMKFLCDSERCIECNGCVTACKNEHEVPWGVNRRRVVTLETRLPVVVEGGSGEPSVLDPARLRRRQQPLSGDPGQRGVLPGRHAGLGLHAGADFDTFDGVDGHHRRCDIRVEFTVDWCAETCRNAECLNLDHRTDRNAPAVGPQPDHQGRIGRRRVSHGAREIRGTGAAPRAPEEDRHRPPP